MQCPKCRQENRSQARFCVGCGAALPVAPAVAPESKPEPSARSQPALTHACGACGTALKPDARFCPRCGAQVAEPPQPPSRSVPAPTWAVPPPVEAGPPRREQDQVRFAAQPAEDRRPPVKSPLDVEPEPVQRSPQRRPAWLLGLMTAFLSALCIFCAVVGGVVGASSGGSVAAVPDADPSRPDVTVYVDETYVSTMLDGGLPEGVEGTTSLDVKPDNLLVLSTRLDLMFVRPEITVTSRLSVQEGRIQIVVEDVEAEGHDIFRLIGIDGWTLGDALVDVIQEGLERELGPGSKLMDITTDEHWIILTARLN
jgi:hypothetical protein